MNENLLKNIYTLVKPLKGVRILKEKWIYIIKFDKNSNIEHFKAR